MAHSQMVKIRFEGKNLADCDFFTKSDPYLIISRPSSRGVYTFKQVKMPLLFFTNSEVFDELIKNTGQKN